MVLKWTVACKMKFWDCQECQSMPIGRSYSALNIIKWLYELVLFQKLKSLEFTLS